MLDPTNYEGREQAYVKHYVLRTYLETLTIKLGMAGPRGLRINYVDGFSGPWKAKADDLSDTSPHIALSTLGKTRDHLKQLGRHITVAGLFIEQNAAAYEELKKLVSSFDGVETHTVRGTFETKIEMVAAFMRHGHKHFSFVFIDPKGWTGFGMEKIRPVLQQAWGEVLINFMTKDISRFVDSPREDSRATFIDLFGTDRFAEEWRGLEKQDREDAIVNTYCKRIRDEGRFPHVVSTIVLHPTHNRTHYHLVYATRSVYGLAAFRETERKALEEQSETRGRARQADRVRTRGQTELFGPRETEVPYITTLEQRYRPLAKQDVFTHLMSAGTADYRSLVGVALAYPTVSEKTLKDWLKEALKKGDVEFVVPPRKKVPNLNRANDAVRWTGSPR